MEANLADQVRVNPGLVRRRYQALVQELKRHPTQEELEQELTGEPLTGKGQVGYSETEAKASMAAAEFGVADFSPSTEGEADPESNDPGHEDVNDSLEEDGKMEITQNRAFLLEGMKKLDPGNGRIKVSELLTFLERKLTDSQAKSLVNNSRYQSGLLDSPATGLVKLSVKGKKMMAEWEAGADSGDKGGASDEDKQTEADWVAGLFADGHVENGISREDLKAHVVSQNYTDDQAEYSVDCGLELATIVEVDDKIYRKGEEPTPADGSDADAKIDQTAKLLSQQLKDAISSDEEELKAVNNRRTELQVRISDHKKKLERVEDAFIEKEL